MLISQELTDLVFRFNDAVYEPGHLDAKTKDLIAASNAVVVDCLPCLEYHYKSAIENGATPDEIKEAVAVAIAVSGGNKFAKFSATMSKLDGEGA